MTDQTQKMLRPFGSTISEQFLPEDLVKDFLMDLKTIRALPTKERENRLLAPQFTHAVEAEYKITPKVLEKYKSFLAMCISQYCQYSYPNVIFQNLDVHAPRYTVQKINQINSLHNHIAPVNSKRPPQISCVGYLQIPDMLSTSSIPTHHNISGNIEFFEGSQNHFKSCCYKKIPSPGIFLVFPSHLAHWVYPFTSKDKDAERISFSMNAVVEYTESMFDAKVQDSFVDIDKRIN